MSRIFWFIDLYLLFLVPLPSLSIYKISFAPESASQIKGSVIDTATKASAEYAFVSLFHGNDTVPIQITH